MNDKLKSLGNFMERELFCKAFEIIIPYFIELMWDKGCDFMAGDFKIFRNEEEFFIIHLESGTMISWYKNLGRANSCNKKLTLKEFYEFLLLLDIQIKEDGLI